MVKYTLVVLALGSVELVAEMREWHNADRTKSFQAEYISATETEVILLKAHKKLIANQSALSEEDRAWIKVRAAEQAKEKEEADRLATAAAKTVFYETLIKNLHFLNGEKLEKKALEKTPQRYILYFTASW